MGSNPAAPTIFFKGPFRRRIGPYAATFSASRASCVTTTAEPDRRFSGVGHVAVAIVLLTGIVNTMLILGGLPTNFASPYQLLLAIKIALVLLMIGVALVNRYVAVPRLARTPWALRGIVIGTCTEMLLGGIVVALVSAFATFDPMGMAGDS